MDDNNIDALIAAGAVVGASAINAGSQAKANKKNLELAQYSYEQQKQMIAEQNAYNSPVSQMQRYRDAGLNPNLIYGQIGDGNQSGFAQYDAPQIKPVDYGQIGGSLLDALRLSLEYQSKRKDMALRDEQIYSQKMAGLGLQQDYYSKFLDNAIKSQITGVNPGLILSNEELESLRSSRAIQRYDSESQSVNLRNDLLGLQQQINNLQIREKNWIFNNMLPYQLKLLQAQEYGKSLDNELKDIQLSAERELSSIGGTANASRIAKIFVDLLRVITHGR